MAVNTKETYIKRPSFLTLWERGLWKCRHFEPIEMRQMLRTKLDDEEIIFLCYIGLRVGNNITRVLSAMEDRASWPRLMSLKYRLGIEDSSKNDPKVVTLSRVLACFPEMAIRTLLEQNPAMKISHEELKLIHGEYPAAARTLVAASVLPYGLTMREAQDAFALLTVPSLKLSEVINANRAMWIVMRREQRARTSVAYVGRCFNAEVLSKEMRVSKAVEFGMVEIDGGALALSGAWRAAGAAAAAWLKSEYDFDITEPLDHETYSEFWPEPAEF